MVALGKTIKIHKAIVIPALLLANSPMFARECADSNDATSLCSEYRDDEHAELKETDRAFLKARAYQERSNWLSTSEEYDEYVDALLTRSAYAFLRGKADPDDRAEWRGMGFSASREYENVLQAEKYLRIAAAGEEADAQYELGKVLLVKSFMEFKGPKSWIMYWNIQTDEEQKPRVSWFDNPVPGFFHKYGLSEDAYHQYLERVNAATDPDEIDEEAALWIRKAAEQGHVRAQFSMGAFAFWGIGRNIDHVESYAWYILAVAQEPPFGSERRNRFAQYLTAEEKNAGEALATEYMRRYSDLFKRSSHTIIQ